MRNTNLHTICILALGLVTSIAAHAELDPNMEATVCGTSSDCMFQGNPQVSDNLRGLGKIPVQAKLQKVNDYTSNPSQKVNLTDYPQFAPVGELRSLEKIPDGRIKETMGSSVIVSPCYILTAYHVAFREEMRVEGKDYTMTFSAGHGADQGTFAGHTDATPVVWGDYDGSNNDWAIMRLKNCVGTMPQFGWAEASKKTASDLVAKQVKIAAVGYSYKNARGQLSLGAGKIVGKDSGSHLITFDASMAAKESGGPLFTMEDGQMKIAAIVQGDIRNPNEAGADTFANFDAKHANFGTSVNEVLNRADVKALLDDDKAQFGQQNPALQRNARPLTSNKTQMASI